MQLPRKTWIVLAAFLLAGCASPTQQHSANSPIFADINSPVQSGPVFPLGGPVETASLPSIKSPPLVVMPQNHTAESWVPLQRWSRVNGLGGPVQLASKSSPAFALQSTNGVFLLRIGSESAQWDGLEVRLGFAPQLIDGQPYVHGLDLRKTILPLLQGEPTPVSITNPVVVIDPGHGGENAGTRSVLGNHYEKEFTLDWARRLQAVLIASNCRAFLTRSNDSDLALSNRVAFADKHNAGVFISLHFNSAAPNEGEAGLETYCLTPMGLPSTLTRGFADEIQQSFPNNSFDNQNLFLALRVHRAVLQVNGHHDRGIRRARFLTVLRGQQRAAILVEGGYLSNPQEARLIGEPAYRQRLAEAVAKALLMGANTPGTVAYNAENSDVVGSALSPPIEAHAGQLLEGPAGSSSSENPSKTAQQP